MNIAVLTEMRWQGQLTNITDNMRTEFCWMYALNATHYNIHDFNKVHGYDAVLIIFPKAMVKLNRIGIEMSTSIPDSDMSIYSTDIVKKLKEFNKLVGYIQEGPSDFFTDYSIKDQFNFYSQLSECDIIFAHNKYDLDFYKGLFPTTHIEVIPSLMIETSDIKIENIYTPKKEQVIIGGNFCSWYNGFQSYIVASEFDCPIYCPSMHCKRINEEKIPNLTHLQYMDWKTWMQQLTTYKYAVHLMPTVAAGTFSLNCAYSTVPCIGNEKVDTQKLFFPELSVDVHDIYSARLLALKLKTDKEFYEHCQFYAKQIANNCIHTNLSIWQEHMIKSIYG